MLKKTITYTDYNDEECTEDLYFNLNKSELFDLQDMAPRMQAWRSKTTGSDRELTTEEVMELLEIVKTLMQHSYGIRNDDGKRFSKDAAIWNDFKQTAAYDAFLMGLFEDPEEMLNFVLGVVPKSLADDIPEVKEMREALLPSAPPEIVPPWIQENREPTKGELEKMTPAQLREVYKRKSAG